MREQIKLFGGKIGNFTNEFSNEEEKHREKKHLNAYLKGATRYRHGYERDATGLLIRPLQEKWYPVIRINAPE